MTDYLESQIEARLRERVNRRGGLAIKMTPNPAGLPDRLLLLPDGESTWVELKRPGERSTRLQEHWHSRLRNLGQKVVVLDSMNAVEEFLRGI